MIPNESLGKSRLLCSEGKPTRKGLKYDWRYIDLAAARPTSLRPAEVKSTNILSSTMTPLLGQRQPPGTPEGPLIVAEPKTPLSCNYRICDTLANQSKSTISRSTIPHRTTNSRFNLPPVRPAIKPPLIPFTRPSTPSPPHPHHPLPATMKFPTLSTLLLLSLLTTALATPVTDTAKDAQLDICQQTLSYNDLSAGLDKCGLTSDDNDYPTPEQLTCFCTIPQMDHHWAVYVASPSS